MKKRIHLIALVLVCLLVLAGCGCEHEWLAATCDAPKTCALCGETEGAPAGHSWQAATCSAPKTCENCGATEGEALEHTWTDATCEAPKTCSVCGATEGEALGHTWIDATYDAPMTCEVCGATEGEPLQRTTSDFTDSEVYKMVCQLIDENLSSMNPEYKYDADNQILYIYLTAPEGTAQALYTAPDAIQDSWNTIRDGMCTMTSSSCEAFESTGYGDISCCMMLLNDANTDNVLLGVLDGVVIYDVLEE